MQRVGGFSDAEDPGALPDRMVYAERDASGRLFTVSRNNEAVLAFSSDGELLQQLGSAADGPGEFSHGAPRTARSRRLNLRV